MQSFRSQSTGTVRQLEPTRSSYSLLLNVANQNYTYHLPDALWPVMQGLHPLTSPVDLRLVAPTKGIIRKAIVDLAK